MARRPFFSGNYGSALGSTANAANLIARAGETQGQMFANMGAQIGGMIQQYGLNKEKRDKAEAAFQADAGRLMKDNPQKFVSMQSDPVIGKALKRIQEGKGTQADFDKYNAFRAADKEAIIEKLKLDNARTQQEMLKVQARVEKQLADPRVRKAIADATTAQVQADYAPDQQTSMLAARGASTDATIQSTKQSEESFPLEMENLVSEIRSRNIFSGKALMDAVGIQGNAPADLEKRFSEIATQLNKIDDSRIKVKTSGLFGGEEKEITFKEFNENPDNYAPVTSDRIKALQASKDRLVQEQTEGMFDVKIPAFDPETGESILITLRQKIEYDEARRKKKEEEEQALQQANQINVRSQLQGVRN